MVKIKGGTIIDSMKYINETFSPADIEKAKAILTEEDRSALFSKTILSVSRIYFKSIVNFTIAVDKVAGKGDLALVKHIATATSESNFKGVYKIFMSFLSPKTIINKVPNIWRQQLDQGECKVIWEDDHQGAIEVSSWEAPLNHELLQIPYYIKALTIAGGKNVKVTHPQCIARGDDKCVFHFEFE